jgi:hypothetical protein
MGGCPSREKRSGLGQQQGQSKHFQCRRWLNVWGIRGSGGAAGISILK